MAIFPERAHLVGAYSLGKAQRIIALIRSAGYEAPIYLHGAIEKITRYYESRGIDLGQIKLARDARKSELAGAIVLCPPSALREAWSRRFPDPVTCFASGWMRVRARARQRLIALPLVISDHADWERSYRHDCRHGRPGNLGHPWPGGRAGALERQAGRARASPRYRRLRR